MSNLNPEIQKILDDHGIDPAPIDHAPMQDIKKRFDEKFGDPMKQIDDLFDTFGKIFGPKFHEDRQKNYDDAKKKEDES